MKTFLLLFGLACAGNGASQRYDTTGDAGGWAQRVIGTEYCLDAFSDRRCAHWYRPGTDPVQGPMWFLLAQGGDACAVTAELFTMAVIGERFDCRWRHAR